MSEEQVALVTGGSRGIGRAIAVELSRAGYRVIITYKANDAAAEETLALIRSNGGQGEAVPPRIWLKRSVKRASGTGRVSNQEDARSVCGKESFRCFVDCVVYAACFVYYEQHAGCVVALKAFRRVGR